MVPMDELVHLSVRNAGRPRLAKMLGRAYYVVPMTTIVPGVLNGSKGPLYYPPEEVSKNPSAWDGIPLLVYHPTSNGRPVRGNDPDVIADSGIGTVYRTRFQDGRLRSEGWFDIEATRNYDKRLQAAGKPAILPRLERGEPIELSTGLYTDNTPAANGARDPKRNKPYSFIARNYRPDHLAILPDQRGACSVADGCGVHNGDGTACRCDGKCKDCKAKAEDVANAQARDNKGRYAGGHGSPGQQHISSKLGTRKVKDEGRFQDASRRTDRNAVATIAKRAKSPQVARRVAKAIPIAKRASVGKVIKEHLSTKLKDGINSKAERLAVGLMGRKIGKLVGEATAGKITKLLGLNREAWEAVANRLEKYQSNAQARDDLGRFASDATAKALAVEKAARAGTASHADAAAAHRTAAEAQFKFADSLKTDHAKPHMDQPGKAARETAWGAINAGVGHERSARMLDAGLLHNHNEETDPPEHTANEDSEVDKTTLVSWLTSNCACWQGDDQAKTLNGLDRTTLQLLKDTAEEGLEAVATVNALREEFDVDAAVANGEVPAFIKKKTSAAPAEEEEEEEAPAPKGGKGVTVSINKDQSPMTTKEWLAANGAPPSVVAAVTNAEALLHQEKAQLVARLTANIKDAKSKADAVAVYNTMDVVQLRPLVAAQPAPAQVQNGGPRPLTFVGSAPAAGPAATDARVVDAKAVLRMPTLNFENPLKGRG
jgi:hypothetical protein